MVIWAAATLGTLMKVVEAAMKGRLHIPEATLAIQVVKAGAMTEATVVSGTPGTALLVTTCATKTENEALLEAEDQMCQVVAAAKPMKGAMAGATRIIKILTGKYY